MATAKLTEYLNSNGVAYHLTEHPRAVTAQEVAAESHISGKNIAKPVIVKADEKIIMIVTRATERADLETVKEIIGARSVELAHEDEFTSLFPECELGAMPPFGNLYGVEVFVSPALASDEEIAFNAGTHYELIQMAYKDFERLVKPRMLMRPI